MSLMLNALKRIESKQTRHRATEAIGRAEPIVSPATVEPAEPVLSSTAVEPAGPIELPPALAVDVLPNIPIEDYTLPESDSLEATINQLQAFVSATGSPDDYVPKFDDAEIDAANPDDAQPPMVLQAAFDPYAVAAQRILGQLPQGRTQVLLFTSPDDGQGKTMTLARLAPRLAQGMEGKVLVVDANFRSPEMARCLAVAPTACLPDVLAGAANWSAAVQISGHAGVSLLPGGADALGHAPGRCIQGLSQLLRELAGHYALVVVDATSLAHRGTAQLAAICDGVYLVVRLGEGSPRALREAAHVIQSNGGRLMGCLAIAAAVCGE